MKSIVGGQFATLDGMRGVGALLVVMAHAHIFFGNVSLLGGGPILVDTFFLLSGFVIAYVYSPRFAKGMDVRTFVIQRLVRLMPLAILATLLGYATLAVCVALFSENVSQAALLSRLIPEMFLLPSSSLGTNEDLFKFNVPLWSLLFELLANVVFVLMVPWLTRRVLIATVLFWGLVLALLSIMLGTTDGGSEISSASLGMPRASYGFFAGVLLYRLVGAPSQPSKRTSWLVLFPMAGVVAMAVIPAEGALRPFIQISLVIIGPIILVFIGQLLEPPRFLQPIMRWAGDMSFPVYVFHWPLLIVLLYYEKNHPGSLTSLGPVVGVLFLAVVLFVSWMLVTFIELPIRKWLTQATRRALPLNAAT